MSRGDAITERFGSGRSVRRTEDDALLTGNGRFVDDHSLPGQAHLVFARSPHAHARIRAIDASAARASPGVVAVVTGADLVAAGVPPMRFTSALKGPGGTPATLSPRHVLAHDVVRCVGEPVGAIVAETREQARDALAALLVDYEELPAVADPLLAVEPGAPQVQPDVPGNVCAEARYGDAAATDAAFARAAHVVVLDLANQRLAPTPLEPRGALASWDAAAGRLTYRVSSQMPTRVRDAIAELLGLPPASVRVLVGDVGGGFGMKTGFYPEDIVVAWCARHLGRPVKWCAERMEEFVSAVHGRDLHGRVEMAFDRDGIALALRERCVASVGAYPTPVSIAIPLLIGPYVATGAYDIPTIDVTRTAVVTNTGTVLAYRGAGRPESIYVVERLMDAAARVLHLDAAELRRRNLVRAARMPYTNPVGQIYDSCDFEAVLDRALALARWDEFDARLADARTRGRLRGRGVASVVEWTGGNAFEERVVVTVSGDGWVELASSTQAMGQGLATTYAQLAVDTFQVPLDRVRIVQGDTDRVTGFGSAGSRSLFTAGSAVRVASERTVDKGRELAAEALEASAADVEYGGGTFVIAGTDRAIGLFELAAAQPARALVVDSTSRVGGPTWPNACHVAEVEIDPETGEVTVASYASVNDVGRMVNPMIVAGQIDGGAVQGIGQALCEHLLYDPASAQPLNASLLGYALPRADQVPRFETTFDESNPCRTNPLGVKGAGELGTIAAIPAVTSAVLDALVRAGVEPRVVEAMQTPLTAERIWRALRT